jgi:hypothetical protein
MKYVVTVHGTLKDNPDKIGPIHNEIITKLSPLSKSMGSIGHQTYLNTQNGKEFFSVDTWDNIEGIQKLYSDPALGTEFAKMFEGQPDVMVWSESGWFHY